MAAQYDRIAEQYQRTKSSPLRSWVEVPSFMRLAGPVAGLRVLDLACGDGFYTRRLRAAGAQVLGIDISAAMIELAEAEERQAPLGLQYLRADVTELPELGCFDLVTAAYLLHYAPDRDALFAMCRNIARCLSSGGRFVALNENPGQPAETQGEYAGYGFSKSVATPLHDAASITYRMISGREVFRFDVHWYSRRTYEEALRAAGFGEISWRPLQLDPAGAEAMGSDYFAAYLENPPVLLLECRL